MVLKKYKKLNMRLLSFCLVFMIAFSPLLGIKKVKAEPLMPTMRAVQGCLYLLGTSLIASKLISNNFSVSPSDLETIRQKTAKNLTSLGTNAVEQFNKFGEAVANGVSGAALTALAKGTVVYACIKAIQDTLFSADYATDIPVSSATYVQKWYYADGYTCKGTIHKTDSSYDKYIKVTPSYGSFYRANMGYQGTITKSRIDPNGSFLMSFNRGYDAFLSDNVFASSHPFASSNYISLYDSYGKCVEFLDLKSLIVFGASESGHTISYVSYSDAVNRAPILTSLLLGGSVINDLSVKSISNADSITLPTDTTTLTDILDAINNWDGTKDLTITLPAGYEFTADNSIALTPGYIGSDVTDKPIDPTPTVPETPSDITMPWLAALLALLGIGSTTPDSISGLDTIIDGITSSVTDAISGINDIVDSITSSIADVITGIGDLTASIADSFTTAIAPVLTGIRDFTIDLTANLEHFFDPPDQDINLDGFKNIILFDKFPFSIPKDLVYLFGMLAADPLAPKIDFEFQTAFLGQDNYVVTMDLSEFNGVAAVVRSFQLVAFTFFMVYVTKNMIWK